MEKFELNDFRKLRGLSEVTFSPDGRHIAVVVKSCFYRCATRWIKSAPRPARN